MSDSRDQRMPEPVCDVGAEGLDTERLRMHLGRLRPAARACERNRLERDTDHVSMGSVQIIAVWPQRGCPRPSSKIVSRWAPQILITGGNRSR
jgi:hypothetical protein